MFGKKKEPRQSRPVGSLEQYGIFEIPDINIGNINNNMKDDDDDDDESLEVELAALAAGNDTSYKSRRSATRKSAADVNLDEMTDCLKDTNSDEESIEEDDDPALLRELQTLTGNEIVTEKADMSELMKEEQAESNKHETKEEDNSTPKLIELLQERLKIYEIAEEKAKRNNETSRARRYNRGIKTLKEMLVSVQSDESINEADIPPALPSSATTESTVQNIVAEEKTSSPVKVSETIITSDTSNNDNSPAVEDVTVDQEALDKLKKQQQKYKTAAVAWKRAGNKEQALEYVKTVKQFDIVIAAVAEGEKLDLSDMPPTPILPSPTSTATPAAKEENELQQQGAPAGPAKCNPENIEGALKECLEVYRRTKVAAEDEGNTSKARRYGRICKQFEDAIKLYTHGKTVPLEELPVPPGFPPLILTPQNSDITVQSTSESESPENNNAKKSVQPKPPIPPPRGQKSNQRITSRAEKQMLQLQLRQRELKQAALNAKKDGDMDLARDYLRQAKGIQPLVEASKAGLPVDMTSIPLSPLEKVELSTAQKDENFVLISSKDFSEDLNGTDDTIYENLETQLMKQIKWCLSTRDHSKALGDVPGYNRWERLALSYTRDLDMLRVRKRDSLPPPQHHYETKTYQIVQSCTDLNDNDIEISIIRGINYSREADTYVMYEFPFPLDNHPIDRTLTIKDSANPEYQAIFLLNGIINRTSRQCQRAFKRHALKCEIWTKGCSLNPILCCTHPRGFFRSDSLLGTVMVKLQPLESQCILHDSFPLMDGRKATGGKLELKIRLRNPILFKQIENITDKWLTIDQ
ncbi:PREDICTED: coiled-coil and C2 domain-containing protein 1-like isoform X2 [Trachymyrmex septentrionalis]|uniref:coiled-coil and C2 domain-containing protein 1-like isoform X2 n=1 Tax=Trachymyrmex septentrionalis TaxID=34720 RepID=UPI00084EF037|nr:PREDICTED: coiled-coil and C2 domain-containing protein 1-like isoform X2 [Trachymyrmex septentrionalis]